MSPRELKFLFTKHFVFSLFLYYYHWKVVLEFPIPRRKLFTSNFQLKFLYLFIYICINTVLAVVIHFLIWCFFSILHLLFFFLFCFREELHFPLLSCKVQDKLFFSSVFCKHVSSSLSAFELTSMSLLRTINSITTEKVDTFFWKPFCSDLLNFQI